MQPENPVPQSPTPPQQPATPQPVTIVPPENPGKTLGIIGIIMPFVGMSLIGLIVSIISFKRSKRVGAPTVLGLIGIIINSVLLLLIVPILALIAFITFNGVQERAHDTEAQVVANTVLSRVEAFNAVNGKYPRTISELNSASETRLPENVRLAKTEFRISPTDPGTVALYECEGKGNKIGYWNSNAGAVLHKSTFRLPSDAHCTLVTN